MLGLAPTTKYDLSHSECYMRLLHGEDLHKEWDRYDPVVLTINPPHGQTSRYTKPFDVLLFVGDAPIALFNLQTIVGTISRPYRYLTAQSAS